MSRRRGTALSPVIDGPPPFAGTPREQIPTDHPEYARRTLDELRRYWGMARLEDSSFLNVLHEVEAAKLWRVWPPGKPYGDLDALCKAELGQDTKGVRAALAQARALTPQPIAGYGGAREQGNNITLKRPRGTGADYLVSRLARDHPEHLRRLQRGEYRSVAAAARDAGIPVKDRIQIEPTVANFARSIRAKLTPEQIAELLAEISTPERAVDAHGVRPRAASNPL